MCTTKKTAFTVCAHSTVALLKCNTTRGRLEFPHCPSLPRSVCRHTQSLELVLGWCSACEAHFRSGELHSIAAVQGFWDYKALRGWDRAVDPGLVPASAVLAPQRPPDDASRSKKRETLGQTCEERALRNELRVFGGVERSPGCRRCETERTPDLRAYVRAMRAATLEWAAACEPPEYFFTASAADSELELIQPRPIYISATVSIPTLEAYARTTHDSQALSCRSSSPASASFEPAVLEPCTAEEYRAIQSRRAFSAGMPGAREWRDDGWSPPFLPFAPGSDCGTSSSSCELGVVAESREKGKKVEFPIFLQTKWDSIGSPESLASSSQSAASSQTSSPSYLYMRKCAPRRPLRCSPPCNVHGVDKVGSCVECMRGVLEEKAIAPRGSPWPRFASPQAASVASSDWASNTSEASSAAVQAQCLCHLGGWGSCEPCAMRQEVGGSWI